MKVSRNWLREFVDLPETTEELREVLDNLGLVVEGVEEVGLGLEDIVVARVKAIHTIAGADRVRLVVVEAGEGPLDIVCGAFNFAEGNYVALAPVGAVLPGGVEIAARTMRGVTSHGMLCSASELRLSEDHRGLMILDELIDARPGERLVDALDLETDVVFDISVEINRPDAWSVEGVARDLATRLGRTLRQPPLAAPTATLSSTLVSAAIDAPAHCGRLEVSLLRGVRVGPSPARLTNRLRAAGMRPISNVVDASNYVMLELGQPTHPYDGARVADRHLGVRLARAGEQLTTLDGVSRTLAQRGRGLGDTGEDCVIVDGNDTVLGLAGVMGGASSEIEATTTEVVLEAANFDAMTIARSSRRHGLRTEASSRFERGVDPDLTERASARFVELLRESSPDLEWLTPLVVNGELPERPSITLRVRDVEALLGVAIERDEMVATLRGLGFHVTTRGETLNVTAPGARPDVRSGVAGRADLIEEIARVHGYRRLGRHVPTWSEPGGLGDRLRHRRRLRDVLVDAGCFEVWTATLTSDDDVDLLDPQGPRVRVHNPLADDASVLRTSLLPGLVRVVTRHVERGGEGALFAEMGNVFRHPDASTAPRSTKGGEGGQATIAMPEENERATILLARANDDARAAVALWHHVAGRFGLVESFVRSLSDPPAGLHPSRGGEVLDASGRRVGFVGELDPALGVGSGPRVGLLDLDLDVLFDVAKELGGPREVRLPSRFPSAAMDFAFVAPSTLNAAELAAALRRANVHVESVALFDAYQGEGFDEGHRGLAYRVRASAPDRTLDEADLATLRAELVSAAATRGATLRS